MKPLEYVEMEPAADVSDIAMTYWGFTVRALPYPAFVHRVWPDGCATLAMSFVHGTVAVLVGARTTALDVPVTPGEQYWGIRFRPEAGAAFCQVRAAALRDGRLDAVDTFGAAIRSLTDALQATSDPDAVCATLDAWIRRVRPPENTIDSLVRDAVCAIVTDHGAGRIADLAAALGITSRQLQRRFREATGLTPKEFAVIRRARASLTRLADGKPVRLRGGWARLAAEAGFADQAHLSREYARLLRSTPTSVASRIDAIAHRNLQP